MNKALFDGCTSSETVSENHNTLLKNPVEILYVRKENLASHKLFSIYVFVYLNINVTPFRTFNCC